MFSYEHTKITVYDIIDDICAMRYENVAPMSVCIIITIELSMT